MSLNETPSGQRTHIGFFGCRNAGKSSLVNAVTGQALAIVSDVLGTTTDPVLKAMELLPLGPVVVIDTPGFDDTGPLGELRVKRTRDALNRCDIAVLVADGTLGLQPADQALLEMIRARSLPHLIAWNKSDRPDALPPMAGSMAVSAKTGMNIDAFKEALARAVPDVIPPRLAGDLVSPGDVAVLVCPMDESAPKGRLILPQQQTIRDLLDADALALVTKETALERALQSLCAPPKLVITDSQAFKAVAAIVPDDVPLTSFSILMARYKGFLEAAVAGVSAIDRLRDGDRVLMAEGCTHHRQCNDIGTVKIPRWLRAHTGREIVIETCTGRDFPDDLTPYRVVIHCGGCMLTENAVQYRMKQALSQGVAFTNYGIVIARITGALERSLRPFPALHGMLTEGAP
ncbi:MAG: [Clostridia bacterium]|nr:[FeFe] hydrogenase H-cluster maturation GTPase HydF [Clostridia bacterium]